MNLITSNIMKIKTTLLSLLVVMAVLSGAGLLATKQAVAMPVAPVTTLGDTVSNCSNDFLGLKPWYYFLPADEMKDKSNKTDPCGIKCFNIFVQANPNDCGETNSDIPGVILAIIDDLLRIAALVAVAFVIYGSFQYVGSRGNSDRTAQAQSTLIGALTGLAVALVAVAFVSFLGNQLGG